MKRERVPYSDQEAAILLSKRPRTSHLLHLVLTLITAGMWVFVWVLVALSNKLEGERLERKVLKGKRATAQP